MLFRDHNTTKYKFIFCVLCNKYPHPMDTNEFIAAIMQGKNIKTAVFSERLLKKKFATLFAKSWCHGIHSADNNYWIIELDMTDAEYCQHRKSTGFSNYRPIGAYLHPIKHKIISCSNALGVSISKKELVEPQQTAACIIL